MHILVTAGVIVPIILIIALFALVARRSAADADGLLSPTSPWVPVILLACVVVLGIAITAGAYA